MDEGRFDTNVFGEFELEKRKLREEGGKSFVVRKGVTDEVRDSIRMANGKLGYVYLVDRSSKNR